MMLGIEEIKKLRVVPGDIIVLKCPELLSEAVVQKIKEDVKSLLDFVGIKDVGMMILEEGMDIEILKQERNKKQN